MCTSGEMLNFLMNVEHFEEKWPPVGHFEFKSVQNWRCTSSMCVQSLCKGSKMLNENCAVTDNTNFFSDERKMATSWPFLIQISPK